MTDTYTIINRHGDVIARNLNGDDAARTILEYDGHDFDVRAEMGRDGALYWALYVSPGGGCPMVRSRIYSLCPDRWNARAEIMAKVRRHSEWWNGLTCRADADCDAMMAELAESER